MILNSTTSTLKLVSAQASNLHVLVDYVDYATNNTAPSLVQINRQATIINTATNTTILAAPSSANISRQVLNLTIHNISTTQTNAITINLDDNATLYEEYDCTVGLDEKVFYTKDHAWKRADKYGNAYCSTFDVNVPLKTYNMDLSKVSVGTSEAAGILHSLATGAGILPAWAIGASGLTGRAVTKTETGFLPLQTSSNRILLTSNGLHNSISAAPMQLVDILYVNNGLVVTTTTAQTINSVPLPSRDVNGTINGVGCIWALLVTTATTNAAAITNMSFSYTDQDGNAGATTTIPSFPATAAVGTVVPFLYAPGDTGGRSVQSITLGTSLVAGAVSLICFRIVDTVQTFGANLSALETQRNIKLRGDEALTVMLMAVNASAYAINPCSLTINEY